MPPEPIVLAAAALHLSGMALIAQSLLRTGAAMERSCESGAASCVFVGGSRLLAYPNMLILGAAGLVFLSVYYMYFSALPSHAPSGSVRFVGTIGSFLGAAIVYLGVRGFAVNGIGMKV